MIADEEQASSAGHPHSGNGDDGLYTATPVSIQEELDILEADTLHLDLHPEDAVWMSQVGHLRQWCPSTRRCCVTVPTALPRRTLHEGLRQLFVFQHLQVLDLTFPSHSRDTARVEQGSIAAVCELHALRALKITGGTLDLASLDFEVLSRLPALQELTLRPFSDEGLGDSHLQSLAHLTHLRSLSFRGSLDFLSDDGVQSLSSLTALTHLGCLPLGTDVTAQGLAVLATLPALRSVTLGMHDSRQVAVLQDAPWLHGRCVSLVTDDLDVDLSVFFTTLTLCVHTGLVSLRLSKLQAPDATFLISIGTLSQLSELKVSVSLAPLARPFVCELAVLHTLHRLRSLALECVRAIQLPFTAKLAAALPLYWPHLTSLALSLTTRPELASDALSHLRGLSHLSHLSLLAPLGHHRDGAAATAATLRRAPSGVVVTTPGAAAAPGAAGGGVMGSFGGWFCLPVVAPAPVVEDVVRGRRRSSSGGGFGGGSGGGSRTVEGLKSAASSAAADALLTVAEHAAVNLSELPQGLTHLVLECASLTAHLPLAGAGANGGNGDPASHHTQHGGADGGGGGGSDVAGLLVLPELLRLELNDCHLLDAPCCALLHSALRLQHLELNEVAGLSDHSIAALRHTTGLRHLALQRSATVPPLKGAAATTMAATAGVEQAAGVSNDALASLAGLDRLAHLEWAVGRGATAQQLSRAVPVLGSLNGLRYLSVYPAVRAAGAGPATWQAEVLRHLPLCTVTEAAPALLYNLWDDLSVTL